MLTLQPAKKVCRQDLFFPEPARWLKWQNILRRVDIPFDDAVQEYTSRHRAQPEISGPEQNQRLPGRNRYPGKTEKVSNCTWNASKTGRPGSICTFFYAPARP